jgi:hypothetical protein
MNRTTSHRYRLVRTDQLHEVRYAKDLNSAVATEPKQVAIAGHNKLRGSRDRAFEDAVVVRICHYGVDRLTWADATSEIANARRSLVERFFRPAKLIPQNTVHFIKQCLGDREREDTAARAIEEWKWSAGEHQSGDVDVRIGGDL